MVIIISTSLVFLVGLIDDLFILSPFLRLAIQIAIAFTYGVMV